MMQSFIVAVIVICAASYAIWTLLPQAPRERLLRRVDARLALGGGPAAAVLRTRLLAPLLRRAAPAGGCAACASNPPSTVQPGATPVSAQNVVPLDAARAARRTS
jgi:hypothetical protein